MMSASPEINDMKTQATFTKSQWASFEIIATATKTTGQIKRHNGSDYEWKSGGKRVTAQKIK
jgi:hypothetical protein